MTQPVFLSAAHVLCRCDLSGISLPCHLILQCLKLMQLQSVKVIFTAVVLFCLVLYFSILDTNITLILAALSS